MNVDKPATTASLRQFRAFVEVYRTRKLSSAAERLYLTPSAVSVLLKQFEATAGTTLFDRTTRALTPTAAADELLPIAERILRDVRLTETAFRGGTVGAGRVAIAVTPTIAMVFLPPLIRHVRSFHPDIVVHVIDGETEQFIPRVLSGQVDFGIGSLDRDYRELQQRALVQDHLALACLPTHPLARFARLKWTQLAGHPLISVKSGYGIRKAIDRTAARVDVMLDIEQEVSLLTTALAMSASDLGASIVPAGLVALSGFDALVARKIHAPVVTRNISIVTRQGCSPTPAARTFIDALAAQCARHTARERR